MSTETAASPSSKRANTVTNYFDTKKVKGETITKPFIQEKYLEGPFPIVAQGNRFFNPKANEDALPREAGSTEWMVVQDPEVPVRKLQLRNSSKLDDRVLNSQSQTEEFQTSATALEVITWESNINSVLLNTPVRLSQKKVPEKYALNKPKKSPPISDEFRPRSVKALNFD